MKLGSTFVVKQKNNVVKDLRQVYLPITTTNQENFTVIAYKDPQADTVPVTTFPSTTEQADTVPGKDKPEKIMQLRIPLMSSHVMTATVKTVTQEILEENPLSTVCNELLPPDIQPTLDEEIPEEAYNQILAGLRQDPDLCKLMEEIEQDHDLNEILEEFVQDPDMDIDLPIEDDRLERELENWEAW